MSLVFFIKRYIAQRKFWQQRTYAVTFVCTPIFDVGVTILTLPLETSYQQLITPVSLSPTITHHTKKIGENMVYLIANDLFVKATQLTMKFTVTVSPRHRSPRPISPRHNKALVDPVIKRIYLEVMQELTYGNPIRGLYSYEQAMKKRCVDCGGFASVLEKRLRDEHIEARIVAGFWAGYDDNTMHAWVEYLDSTGRWIPLDAATDFLSQQGRTYKTGGCGYVGSDRVVLSVGSHFNLDIANTNTKLDILQTPITVTPDNAISYIDDYSFSTKVI